MVVFWILLFFKMFFLTVCDSSVITALIQKEKVRLINRV